MEQIIEYLRQTYDPLGIIVYGSFADGSNNTYSDFDVLVITESGAASHDNSIVNGIRLDAFIYPKEMFLGEIDHEAYLQIFDGKIILDADGTAAELKRRVCEYIDNIVPKTREENESSIAWCEKMLLRAERKNAEGYFRWHWLLTESLEIYCDILGLRYLGPKKSIKRMQAEDPASVEIYERALAGFAYSDLSAWVAHLKNLLK